VHGIICWVTAGAGDELVPACSDDCPTPAFLVGVDHSTEILQALEAALLGKVSPKPYAPSHLDPWSGITTNLRKVGIMNAGDLSA